MAVMLKRGCPYSVVYLCDTGMTRLEFPRRYVLPMAWYGLGSVAEIMDWPMSRLYRVSLLLEEEELVRTFKTLRGDLVV